MERESSPLLFSISYSTTITAHEPGTNKVLIVVLKALAKRALGYLTRLSPASN